MINITQAAKTICYFQYYGDRTLWYQVFDGVWAHTFPIPIEEVEGTRMNKEMKGIFLIKWMREYNKMLSEKQN